MELECSSLFSHIFTSLGTSMRWRGREGPAEGFWTPRSFRSSKCSFLRTWRAPNICRPPNTGEPAERGTLLPRHLLARERRVFRTAGSNRSTFFSASRPPMADTSSRGAFMKVGRASSTMGRSFGCQLTGRNGGLRQFILGFCVVSMNLLLVISWLREKCIFGLSRSWSWRVVFVHIWLC